MKAPARCIRLRSSAPRAYLFTRPGLHVRALSGSVALKSEGQSKPSSFSSSSSSTSFGFAGGPSPPRLPREEQEIFEALQRASTGAFSTPQTPPPRINQSPDSSASEMADAQSTVEARVEAIQAGEDEDAGTAPAKGERSKVTEQFDRVIEVRGKGEELHPNVVRGAQPEFEGDRNPKTGEVGGPKNEPLRWGAAGEWTYNGRTTDF